MQSKKHFQAQKTIRIRGGGMKESSRGGEFKYHVFDTLQEPL
jgi:hypothetical protein